MVQAEIPTNRTTRGAVRQAQGLGLLQDATNKGATYPVWKIGPNRRLKNLHKMLERGNHKSSEDNIDVVQQLTEEDVAKGFAIPLMQEIAPLIKNGEVYPVGLVSNHTFDDKGMPIVRYCIAHDLSFPIKKGIAINDRVNKEELPALQYALRNTAPSPHHQTTESAGGHSR